MFAEEFSNRDKKTTVDVNDLLHLRHSSACRNRQYLLSEQPESYILFWTYKYFFRS